MWICFERYLITEFSSRITRYRIVRIEHSQPQIYITIINKNKIYYSEHIVGGAPVMIDIQKMLFL